MPKEKGILAALLGVLVVLWAWPAAPPCLAAGPDQPDSARQARLKIMGAKGAGASLTIFPVVLWDVARA